jgi:hypothetical protein
MIFSKRRLIPQRRCVQGKSFAGGAISFPRLFRLILPPLFLLVLLLFSPFPLFPAFAAAPAGPQAAGG